MFNLFAVDNFSWYVVYYFSIIYVKGEEKGGDVGGEEQTGLPKYDLSYRPNIEESILSV